MRKLFFFLSLSLLIITCKKKDGGLNPAPDTPPVLTGNYLNSNAYIVDTVAISSVTANSVVINKSLTALRPKVGDILLGAPTKIYPNGFLYKVTSISENATLINCVTALSNFKDAFKQLEIHTIYLDTFSSDVAHKTGSTLSISYDDSTSFGTGIKLKGVINLNISSVTIDYVRKAGSLAPEKIVLKVDFNTDESTLEISNSNNSAKIFPGFKENFPLPDITFTIPVVTPLGILPLPVIMKQEVVISTLSLSLTSKAKWTIFPKISATAGCKYENNTWTNLGTLSIDASATPLAKGDFSPDLSLIATGTILEATYEITPYGIDALKASFGLSNNIELTLKPQTPNYSMIYQFDISGGVNIDIWNGVALNYDISLNLISKTLLEGDWTPDPATVDIEIPKHHLGDGAGNEGILYQKNFTVGDYLSNAKECFLHLTIEGPHYEKPPEIEINSQSIGSIQPFFPNPGDQINPDGSHDYTGAFDIKVNIKSLLKNGVNLFTIKNGRPDDDYWFSNVHLKLTY